ncbi:DMT family transporter [Desulfobaculum bizertense]|uniref:Transporter family-2 protein n=1 Tax=Desulfobaculum bizertense DSM 18034 TaxID=1121442 RepID=A0A1T4WEY8_9BACT|nr:DMT family transporter [Desulfobaculum bizertense]UIJ36692.1 DMT family transporter [Desulfobaculum bizertense]SKA75882.1 transporter family-2 protein [Desulfobaculum bizertense DSM 18034]
MKTLMYLVLALGVGGAMSIQLGVNMRLGGWTHDPIITAFISFVVGSLTLLAMIFLLRLPCPNFGEISQVPWWQWLGGMLGAYVVASSILVGPHLGTTTTFAFIVAGQLAASLVLDHYGMFGVPKHPIGLLRVLGICMVCAGAVLIRRF